MNHNGAASLRRSKSALNHVVGVVLVIPPRLQTSVMVRLSVQLLRDKVPTASERSGPMLLTTPSCNMTFCWAEIAGCCFSDRSYRTLTPRRPREEVLGELALLTIPMPVQLLSCMILRSFRRAINFATPANG